jgi:regulator of cell morphogenesis and NO signaling
MATGTHSIREIIGSNPTAAAVLRRFDIDVCAHADESLHHACADLQLSIEQVLEKLQDAAIEAGAETPDPSKLQPGRLIQYLVRVHHRDIRYELPRLIELAHAVAEAHQNRAPELKELEGLLSELHADLCEHIRKEEQVLFPYIAQLHEEPLLAFRPPGQCFSRVGQPVFMMVQEHERARRMTAELRQCTDDFKPPVWACSAFLALYSGLRAFANRFEEHVRLENDVLFPGAIEKEAQLMRAGGR